MKCKECNGTGMEICNNPDHGFIDAVGGETGRLGCPACGHDELHRIKNTKCEACEGTGNMTPQSRCTPEIIKKMCEYAEEFEAFKKDADTHFGGLRPEIMNYITALESANREMYEFIKNIFNGNWIKDLNSIIQKYKSEKIESEKTCSK